MTIPLCTYRVQLQRGFGFAHAGALAGYLAELGVSHLYCSPYLQAAPGTTHGYDVVDPERLNAEFGGTAGHAAMTGLLRQHGLSQVLDIVPNHMAVHRTNRWWWDVLQNGISSRFAFFFDIDWSGPDDRSDLTVLVPVLADHYGRVLEAGGLQLARHEGEIVLRYPDDILPIAPDTVGLILGAVARRSGHPELAVLADAFGDLPQSRWHDSSGANHRHRRKVELYKALVELSDEEALATAIDAELAAVSCDPDRLDSILSRQHYRLAHWRTANEELDYRRFFNIESLVGVRVEDPEVFQATHDLIFELVRDGSVEGLRIDHVDGLSDPGAYLARVTLATSGTYTVVEKILARNESMPPWPIAGTSGYDFLNRVNTLFVVSSNESAMSDCYAEFTGDDRSYDGVVYEAKQQIMRDELATEVERVTGILANICASHRRHRDHTRRDLRDAVRELVAGFGVYRPYVLAGQAPSSDERVEVNEAVLAAQRRRPDIDGELVQFLGEVVLVERDGIIESELVQRLQQLTAPVMAKGVEDTAFYRYHRLISLNEVGGDPGVFGTDLDSFHTVTAATAASWPDTMLTLSTHDTKRSADVRARLNVLSELPQEWSAAVHRWAIRNEANHREGWPDANTEYLLYQTLVGAWPIDTNRVIAFMTKATKEAKVHTSWTAPSAEYDGAIEHFVRAVLGDVEFKADLEAFLEGNNLVERGRRNSLAQTALLLTCPGVPDIYQGDELWDLSLVDPDNRRPVDYELRRQQLERTRALDLPAVVGDLSLGAPKQWMIRRLLQHRRAHPATFAGSTYEQMPVVGSRAEDVVAFDRGSLLCVTTRRSTGPWDGTSVKLSAGPWTDVLSGRRFDAGLNALEKLLVEFPVAVLTRSTS